MVAFLIPSKDGTDWRKPKTGKMMDEEKGEAGPPQRPDDDAEAWKAKAAL